MNALDRATIEFDEDTSRQEWAAIARCIRDQVWYEPDEFLALWDAYLRSPAWRARRRAVRRRQRGRCFNFQECGNGIHDTHHWHYRNRFDEPLEDLAGVCRPCHARYTAEQRAGSTHDVIFELQSGVAALARAFSVGR